MSTATELAKELRALYPFDGINSPITQAADLLDRVAKLEAVAEAATNVTRYPKLRSPMVELKGALRALEEK